MVLTHFENIIVKLDCFPICPDKNKQIFETTTGPSTHIIIYIYISVYGFFTPVTHLSSEILGEFTTRRTQKKQVPIQGTVQWTLEYLRYSCFFWKTCFWTVKQSVTTPEIWTNDNWKTQPFEKMYLYLLLEMVIFSGSHVSVQGGKFLGEFAGFVSVSKQHKLLVRWRRSTGNMFYQPVVWRKFQLGTWDPLLLGSAFSHFY